jgi:hypothetical protein
VEQKNWCVKRQAMGSQFVSREGNISPLNAKLNPIFHLLALLGAHHNLHVSKIRVKMDLKRLE